MEIVGQTFSDTISTENGNPFPKETTHTKSIVFIIDILKTSRISNTWLICMATQKSNSIIR